MDYIKVETDIWKLQDGSIFEGSANELPKSNASKICLLYTSDAADE